MEETSGGDPLLRAAHRSFICLIRQGHSGQTDNLQEQGLQVLWVLVAMLNDSYGGCFWFHTNKISFAAPWWCCFFLAFSVSSHQRMEKSHQISPKPHFFPGAKHIPANLVSSYVMCSHSFSVLLILHRIDFSQSMSLSYIFGPKTRYSTADHEICSTETLSVTTRMSGRVE